MALVKQVGVYNRKDTIQMTRLHSTAGKTTQGFICHYLPHSLPGASPRLSRHNCDGLGDLILLEKVINNGSPQVLSSIDTFQQLFTTYTSLTDWLLTYKCG